VLSHPIQEIEAFLVAKAPKKKTLLITDPRCLDHAGFDKYHNVARRKSQKEE
jgi:acetoin utilization deacetylase AcuC-like enzyme